MRHAGSLEQAAARKRSLVDRIYDQLKNDLFDFVLVPGDRFTETEIAERLKASRTPVRGALFRLQQEGFLTVLFRNGWQVNPFDFRILDELYDMRLMIECAAVETITAAPGGERVQALTDLADAWLITEAEYNTNGNEVYTQDELFHETITACRGNRELTRVHHAVSDRIRIIRRLDFTRMTRLQATYREHRAILHALLDGDRQIASELLTKHILNSKNEVRKTTLHRLHTVRKTAAEKAE